MSLGRRAAVLLAAAVVALPVAAAWADGEEERAAEAALARGDGRPVSELLQRVRSAFAGSVLKIELEQEDEVRARWVYEVKLLRPQGDVLELEYDAATP